MTIATDTHMHKFEQAKLGKAPYKYLGVTENVFVACAGVAGKAGGTCDFCSNGIRWEVNFESADGHVFKVGTDCAEKAGDAGMKPILTRAKREINRVTADRRKEREQVRIDAALIAMNEDEGLIAWAVCQPHPRGFKDFKTGVQLTLMDDWRWMAQNAGHTGKFKLAKMIEKAQKTRADRDEPAVSADQAEEDRIDSLASAQFEEMAYGRD